MRWPFGRCPLALAVGLCALAGATRAAEPLLVNGAGVPLVWTTMPIPFNPDQGPLGALGNATAVASVTADFGVWAAVSTASIGFFNAGPMPVDVTRANYTTYVGACGDGRNPIVFDTDGSIIDDLFGAGASNQVLGFASPDCETFVPPVITEASAVLNGKWIDGVNTPFNPELSLTDFNAAFTHEFGHYVGLGHSQVNLAEAFDADPTNDTAVATMFPVLMNGALQSSLNLDDRVSVSTLYPAPSFATAFGTITGRILRADGTTPFQGAYVIARQVGDPRVSAVGAASGARYFPSQPGGPPAPGLRGFYELPGLPPGSYTVEVEAIHPAFSGGSLVGPLDPPVALPGVPEFWNGANEANADPPDDPAVAVPVVVAAGATQAGIDVVLNAPPLATNDECGTPTLITSTPFHDLVDTTATTRGATDPVQACSAPVASPNWSSVWYRFTPPVDGTVRADTFGSSYDTVVGAYTGACAAPSPAACNDDAGGFQSETAFRVAGGTTYLIEVTRYGTGGGGSLDFTLDFLPGCGNGVLDAGEGCDDGAANGSNGCCSAVCQRIDTDGDGVCDAHDVCPAVADPVQADADGDGLGDACDLCRTLVPGQSAWTAGKIVVSHLNDGVTGNDKMKLRGQFSLATGSFSIDPRAHGARLEVRGAHGLPKLSVTLPPGPFVSPGPGWRLSTASRPSYVFRDRRPGGTNGITSMLVVDRGGGTLRMVIVGKKATFGLLPADAPLAATVVLGDADAGARGECGEIRFPGPPPLPACTVGQFGTRITCR